MVLCDQRRIWLNLAVVFLISTETIHALTANPRISTRLDLSNGHFPRNILTNSDLLKFGAEYGNGSLWQVVSLNNNAISTVDENVFAGLESILKLSIANNRVSSIHEDGFAGLRRLTLLNLNNNKITELSKQWFNNLTNLEYLLLEGNRITSIADKTFQSNRNLKSLNLKSNMINVIHTEAFGGLSNLQNLNLGGNLLVSFQPRTFITTTNLIELNLNGMEIKRDLFKHVTLPSLKTLMISSCKITSFDMHFFDKFENLEFIEMANNLVSTIPNGLFRSLPKLHIVDLYNNTLSQLSQATLETSFSPNGRYVVILTANPNVCKDCSLVSCRGEENLQSFLCEDPKLPSGRKGSYEWWDEGHNIRVYLVTTRDDMMHWLTYPIGE